MADPKLLISEIISDADRVQIEDAKLKLAEALVGLKPIHQGIVLADTLSMWLAAFIICDETGATQDAETASLREQLLQQHMRLARELVPLSEQVLAGAEVEVETLVKGFDPSTRH